MPRPAFLAPRRKLAKTMHHYKCIEIQWTANEIPRLARLLDHVRNLGFGCNMLKMRKVGEGVMFQV